MTTPTEPPSPAPADAVREMRSVTTINGAVTLGPGSTIGVAGGVSPGVTHRLEGVVPANVIGEALTAYAQPEGYASALAKLLSDQVIVLHGAPGTGKRAGAINLMYDLDKQGPLVMILPDQSLQDLAKRDYAENTSYLLFGWSGEDADSDGGDVGVSALIDKIHRHPTTHLIITSERPVSAFIPHFPWHRPSLRALLDEHAVGDVPVDEAALREHSLTDLVRFARDLANGVDPETSLGTLDLVQQHKVRKWFEDKPDHRDVLEAAALVFLSGVAENVFEPWFERLADMAIPPLPDAQPTAPSPFAPTRRRPPDSLVHSPRRVAGTPDAIPGQMRRYVEFKSPAYRRHVVAELCGSYRMDFWRPLYIWLDELVPEADPESLSQIVHGLSILAEHDFDSVREHFLQPWSNGSHGWRAWAAAVHVLWHMCLDDGAAPLARRTAIRWSRSNDEVRRCAAAFAFSGIVGLLYPGDAMRQLWMLSDKPETAEAAATAIMLLYVALNENGTGDETVVLRSLLSRLDWAARTDLRRFGTTADIMIAVLGVRLEDRSVTARHLREHPGSAPLLGRMWALTVVNRPRRMAVFGTLHDILDDDVGDRVRHDVLAALRMALPVRERRLFATQFATFSEARAAGRAPAFLSVLHSLFSPEQ